MLSQTSRGNLAIQDCAIRSGFSVAGGDYWGRPPAVGEACLAVGLTPSLPVSGGAAIHQAPVRTRQRIPSTESCWNRYRRTSMGSSVSDLIFSTRAQRRMGDCTAAVSAGNELSGSFRRRRRSSESAQRRVRGRCSAIRATGAGVSVENIGYSVVAFIGNSAVVAAVLFRMAGIRCRCRVQVGA